MNAVRSLLNLNFLESGSIVSFTESVLLRGDESGKLRGRRERRLGLPDLPGTASSPRHYQLTRLAPVLKS